MQTNEMKLYQRLYLESLFSKCEYIIENGATTKRNIILSDEEHNIFFHLGATLKTFLSNLGSQVNSDDLALNYLKITKFATNKVFFGTDSNMFRIQTLQEIIDNGREVVDREIGTIEDLQKAVAEDSKEDKALVAN